MEATRIIEIKKNILGDLKIEAESLREDLKEQKTLLVNLMASPGAGKTSLLLKTVALLKDKVEIGVIEADIDSTVDADKLAAEGIPTVQLHTGGMCHVDARMTREGLVALDSKNIDLIFLENVGNLVCPAEFDTGAMLNVMILSVPEGDDKPLKYPLMFSICDVLLINKIDCMDYFDFDIQAVKKRVSVINPNISVFEISAKTGHGLNAWTDWLLGEINNIQSVERRNK